MKREFDPRRLDVEAFAREGGSLEGQWPVSSLERLASSAHRDVPIDERPTVQWRCEGELRPVRGGAPQVWLHLHAAASLSLECQRCLGPVACAVDASRDFLFVHGEDTAAELDADAEEDVLALTRALDLQTLVEDELLLSLPLVPRHDVCPEALPLPSQDPAEEETPPHPFAALAVLKGKASG